MAHETGGGRRRKPSAAESRGSLVEALEQRVVLAVDVSGVLSADATWSEDLSLGDHAPPAPGDWEALYVRKVS